ncbi:MAG: radical SAM protein [Akkermansia sp.]|nr:radical SAM protein [Akkermansia sp.]
MIRTITCTLCLTHDCTLRCRYCYAGRKYKHAMSKDTAQKAIDIVFREAEQTGCAADISFFGGEPLLEWELLQWCYTYATEHGTKLCLPPRFSITTNGTLLTEERLAWLAERDFLIGLSLDGSPAMHNSLRCYPDGSASHADVAKALALFSKFPKLKKQLICVVTPANVHHMREGVEWIAEHYNGSISLNIDYWSHWSDEDFETFSEQYAGVAQLVLQSYRNGTPINLRCVDDKIATHIHENCKPQCRIGEREIAVSVDGNFFPCSRLVGDGDSTELNFGNVHEGINRARQHAIIAQRGCATPECKICNLKKRCLNSCGCTNHAASGKLNEVSPFLCCSEKLLIHTADELAECLYEERNPAFMKKFYPQR